MFKLDKIDDNIKKIEKIVYYDLDSHKARLLMRWVRLTKQKNVTFEESNSKTYAIRNTSGITVKTPVLKIIITYNDNSVEKEYFLGNVQRIANLIANINL